MQSAAGYRALSAAPEVAIVVLWSMQGIVNHLDLEPVAAEARARLERVVAVLKV